MLPDVLRNDLAMKFGHKMLRNVRDIPRNSDLQDFGYIGCLPYVDVMTLDRRMHGYVTQVSKSYQSTAKKDF